MFNFTGFYFEPAGIPFELGSWPVFLVETIIEVADGCSEKMFSVWSGLSVGLHLCPPCIGHYFSFFRPSLRLSLVTFSLLSFTLPPFPLTLFWSFVSLSRSLPLLSPQSSREKYETRSKEQLNLISYTQELN